MLACEPEKEKEKEKEKEGEKEVGGGQQEEEEEEEGRAEAGEAGGQEQQEGDTARGAPPPRPPTPPPPPPSSHKRTDGGGCQSRRSFDVLCGTLASYHKLMRKWQRDHMAQRLRGCTAHSELPLVKRSNEKASMFERRMRMFRERLSRRLGVVRSVKASLLSLLKGPEEEWVPLRLLSGMKALALHDMVDLVQDWGAPGMFPETAGELQEQEQDFAEFKRECQKEGSTEGTARIRELVRGADDTTHFAQIVRAAIYAELDRFSMPSYGYDDTSRHNAALAAAEQALATW
jgi:hypothetical protein